MTLPTMTGEFRVVDDPELRFTPSGKAVGNVRLVANSRKKDPQTQEWVDDKVLWLRGSIWEQPAENMVESISKGDLVNVTGRLFTSEFTDREGNKRQNIELAIDTISPSLRFATAKVSKVERSASGGAPAAQRTSAPAEDPWATPATQSDEPPF